VCLGDISPPRHAELRLGQQNHYVIWLYGNLFHPAPCQTEGLAVPTHRGMVHTRREQEMARAPDGRLRDATSLIRRVTHNIHRSLPNLAET
jgi:hypothetical protein